MSVLLVPLVTVLLLLAPFYLIYKPPSILIRYFQAKWPEVLFQVETSKRIVALTIDDTPSEFTRDILSVLTRYQATATFFVIGSQVDSLERHAILDEIVKQGSELGNHAMRDEPSRSLPGDVLSSQIQEVDSIIEEVYTVVDQGRFNKFFRPGSGFFSRSMLDTVASLHYRLVLGGIYPHDPQISSWRLNAKHILSMVRPGGIIICHDRRSWTLPMLEAVLPELQRRDYKVVTLSTLLSETA